MNGGDMTHIGTIAQDWQETLYNEGYTLDDYSFICRDHLYDETFNQETGEYKKNTDMINMGILYIDMGLDTKKYQCLICGKQKN